MSEYLSDNELERQYQRRMLLLSGSPYFDPICDHPTIPLPIVSVARNTEPLPNIERRQPLKLTGQDVHAADRTVLREIRPWHELSQVEQCQYNDMADELNRIVEQDDVEIEAIKCPKCGHLIADLKNHPCQ